MYLTVIVQFKYPNSYLVKFKTISGLLFEYNSLEDIYANLRTDKNKSLKEKTDWILTKYKYEINNNDFKYIYKFTNPHGDDITIIPDNKLSTKQLLFLYEFNIENNSQIIIKCKDNESEEQELSKQFEALKKSVATTNTPIDPYYSNIL